MIIEFKVANYRSINEEQTLSFVADRATRHPNNLIKRPGYRLLKTIGLFGANASGKSNVVKAIGAMSTFVRDSATKMNDGDPIEAAEPYRLDPETRNAPSRFEITFVTEGIIYTYGFAADRERIHEEWLNAKREKDEMRSSYIKRESGNSSISAGWSASDLSPLVAKLLIERTRPNALFLSTAARENVKELLPVYRYFRDHIEVRNMAHLNRMLLLQTADWCQNDEQLRQQVAALLRDADTGINGLSIQSARPAVPNDVGGRLTQGGDIDDSERGWRSILLPEPQITTSHTDTSGKTVTFDFIKTASLGTQRLFILACIFLDALQNGHYVVLDELNASMHPLLTRRLLEMFQSPEANPNGAQLLFTTHDGVSLDSALFRRDQIVLAEKCDNASQFYSLSDVVPPPRNNESFLRNYLAGRYGGTPYLGRAFSLITIAGKK